MNKFNNPLGTRLENPENTNPVVGIRNSRWLAGAVCIGFVYWTQSFSLAGGGEGKSPVQLKTYQEEKLSNYPVAKPLGITYYGIIPKAISLEKPLQLVNPFAAKSYGYGREMVSWSTSGGEGKPKGFIAFGVRFW